MFAPIVCASCIFYTAIGGIKAVVWTDILQMGSIVASIAMTIILGLFLAGGLSNTIDISLKGHRLDIFNLNIDPTLRDGICAVMFGSTFNNMMQVSVSQTTVQRYLALPTIDAARKAITLFGIGVIFVKLTTLLTGLVMYVKYENCDPILSGKVTHPDQILPYYIMDVASHIPGLPGLFIAGIFSASLSTLSATLNTLAATIYEDFVLPLLLKDNQERQANLILKVITIIMGVICTGLVFVVEQMGGILPLFNSLMAITGGPLIGLFTLGMVFPIANTKGALYGALSGMIFITWIFIGNQWYKNQDSYMDPIKPFSVPQCDLLVNTTKINVATNMELPFFLYRVTYWYYSLLGTAVTVSIGVMVSFYTRKSYLPVHRDLLSPIVYALTSQEHSVKCKESSSNENEPLKTIGQ